MSSSEIEISTFRLFTFATKDTTDEHFVKPRLLLLDDVSLLSALLHGLRNEANGSIPIR